MRKKGRAGLPRIFMGSAPGEMKLVLGGDLDVLLREARRAPDPKVMSDAARIVEAVQAGGDAALRGYERRFGGGKLPLRVSRRDIDSAYGRVPDSELRAVRRAAARLRRAEKSAISRLGKISLSPVPGCSVSKSFEPVPSVGCYVPGGGARYPSSALMSVTAASAAGVPRIVVVSPPGASGDIDPLTLVAADSCGATEIYRAGGAQAIAALAYGTKALPRVSKVVGPGGRHVAAAKRLVSGDVEVDMNAGPTELGVIVASAAYADEAAADLVSQAEHGPDTLCFALTTSKMAARRVRERAVELARSAERDAEVEASLSSGFVAVCRSRDEMVRMANELAPEHLEVFGPGNWSDITGPGLVLLNGTPSAASDYALGSNHVLPTSGTARARGPLSALDFVKQVTRVRASKAALRRAYPDIEALARAEGLPAHADAVLWRVGRRTG